MVLNLKLFGKKKESGGGGPIVRKEKKKKESGGGAGLSLQSNGLFYVDVRLTRSGYKVVSAARVGAGDSVRQDKLANFNSLDEKLRELSKMVSFGTPVTVGIPTHDAYYKNLEYPKLDKEDSILKLETDFPQQFPTMQMKASRYDVFELDMPEYMVQEGTRHYMAVVARVDIIQRLQTAVSYVHMPTNAIEPSPIALGRAFGSVAEANGVQDKFWLTVRMVGSTMQMTTMFSDNPVQFRSAELTVGASASKGAAIADIMRSQLRIMESTAAAPERILICGDEDLDTVRDAMAEMDDVGSIPLSVAAVSDLWELESGFDLTGFEGALALALR